jgi:hypothetical protein
MATKRKPRFAADFLAAAMLILEDYQAFVANAAHAPEDAATKSFAARHAAGRAALAHFEHLLKLASEVGDGTQAKAASDVLNEWRTRMPPQAKEAPHSDDDDAGG